MSLKLFRWQPKDWIDQPLHFLAGFAISAVPLVPIAVIPLLWNVTLIPPWRLVLIGICFLISALLGALREESQHSRWMFDLDLFVWITGSIVGTVFASLVTVYVIM